MREDNNCLHRDKDGVCRCPDNIYAPFTCPWKHPGIVDTSSYYPCPNWEEGKE